MHENCHGGKARGAEWQLEQWATSVNRIIHYKVQPSEGPGRLESRMQGGKDWSIQEGGCEHDGHWKVVLAVWFGSKHLKGSRKSHKTGHEALNVKSISLALIPTTTGISCGAINVVWGLPFSPLDSEQPLKGMYCDLSQLRLAVLCLRLVKWR